MELQASLTPMKIIALLTAVFALSSCATKPYLVGSANDRNKPAKVPGARAVAKMKGERYDDRIQPWNPAGNIHSNPAGSRY